jgi:Leucine-rich repeat (LRR) protein
MKTIDIPDNKEIILGMEEGEKINYVFWDKVYSKLESLVIISELEDFSLHFEGAKFDVPNLKEFCLYGKFALSIFQNTSEDFLCAPLLEEMYIGETEIEFLPVFLKKNKSLKSLTFRDGALIEIPCEIFEIENLQRLSFINLKNIRILPDEIKKLTNLVHFDLWGTPIEYLSPELFLLPKIKELVLHFSSYSPTSEVIEAFNKFKEKNNLKSNPLDWYKFT